MQRQWRRKSKYLRRALATFGAKKVDFVDCLLLAYHVETGDAVVTFDKDLRKLLDAVP